MEKTTAIITVSPGESRYAIAHELAGAGFNIILITDKSSQFEILASELKREYGVDATTIICDSDEPRSREQLTQRILEMGCEVSIFINADGKPLFGSNLERMVGNIFTPKSA